MKKKFLSIFLVFVMVLSVIPAMPMEANAAVSSSVVSGEKMQYISAVSTSGGTTRLSVDNLRGNLNRKSSKAADYWLYADFTSNADEAITGIWIMRSDSLTTIDRYAVTRASVNVNSEGRACYIYYTKDKNAGAPIASVGVWQSEDDYFEYVTNVGTELQEYYNTSFNDQHSNYGYIIVDGDDTDLNADAGSKTAYVYLYYKRAPYVKTQNASFCYDGQPHNGSVTVSDGAVVTYGTGISAIGTHTQTFKVTKDDMLPISGTTQVAITDHDYSVSLNNKVSASCKAAGHETDMKCSKCGAVKAGAVIPKLDHTYKNVICTVCGALEEGWTQIPKSQTYYKIDGDTLYIDGKGDIPNNAFKQKLSTSIVLDGVTKAVIGDSITGIGLGAFQACKSLTSVTIPNSVKSIGPSAFIGCSVLTSVTIPNSVTSIGGSAFAACSNLTSITIPNSVTSIGEGAFVQCSKLTSITIPGSVKSPAANIFSKCTSLKTVVIENGVTSISDYMFNACYALNSVTIPDTVTSIGIQAFYGTSLTSVTIPNSVTSLASNAFYGCSKLNQATLPCRLNYSFANSVRVTKVHAGDAATDAGKAPTCTENGLTEGTHCSVCGAVLTAQEVITASGHTWGIWNVWQEPSCNEPGVRGRICERCYAEETEEIPMTDHYWGSWNVWVEPSCTSTGTRGRFCERCYQSEQRPIATLAHEWQDGYCTRCGEAIFEFSCKNLALNSALAFKFKGYLHDPNPAADAYMEFRIGNIRTVNIPFSDAVKDDNDRYVFTCYLNVLEVDEKIEAIFHDGEVSVERENPLSVTDYLDKVLDNHKSGTAEDTAVINLVNAISNYAHYAQLALDETHTEYEVGNGGKYIGTAARTDITLHTVDDLSQFAAIKTVAEGFTDVKSTSRSLVLDDETAIVIYITPANDSYIPTVKVTDKNGNDVAFDFEKQENGKYKVVIRGIAVHKLADTYTVDIDNGKLEYTNLSALSYAYSVLDSSKSDAYKNAVSALYDYYTATIAYKN